MEKRLGYLEKENVRNALMQLWRVSVVAIFLYCLFNQLLEWTDILIVIGVHYVLYSLGLEIAYHKLLAHRAFKTSNWIRNTLVFIGTLLAHPPVITWVDIHRIHHSNSDKPGDPHSPWVPKKGFWNYLITTKMPPIKNTYEFGKDKTIMWFEINQLPIMYTVSAILILLFGLKTTLVWYLLPSFLSPFFLSVANYYTHQGKYNGYDHARNWYWVEILTPGMGFHGNHHDTAGSWTLAKKYWWIDLSSIVVKLIKR